RTRSPCAAGSRAHRPSLSTAGTAYRHARSTTACASPTAWSRWNANAPLPADRRARPGPRRGTLDRLRARKPLQMNLRSVPRRVLSTAALVLLLAACQPSTPDAAAPAPAADAAAGQAADPAPHEAIAGEPALDPAASAEAAAAAGEPGAEADAGAGAAAAPAPADAAAGQAADPAPHEAIAGEPALDPAASAEAAAAAGEPGAEADAGAGASAAPAPADAGTPAVTFAAQGEHYDLIQGGQPFEPL